MFAPIAILQFVVLLCVVDVTSAGVFPYEVYARTSEGTTNIGGSGGGAYELHEENAAVKVLEVFTEGNNIQALRVTFSNDNLATVGDPRIGPPDHNFTFEPGEKLKGPITLTGNGMGSRAGYMQFSTSKGRTFKAGNENGARQFLFPSGNSYLMGFHGSAGDDIDNIGIFLMKPLQSEKLVNTVYKVPMKPDASKDSLRTENFVNMSTESQKLTITYQKVESTSSEWSVTNSFTATLGLEVSGMIPLVAEVSSSLELSLSTQSTTTSGMATEITNIETRELTNPACSKGTHRIVDFKYRSPISYSGDLLYTFTDLTTFSLPVIGTMKSVFVSDTSVTSSVEKITGGICGSLTPAPVAPPPTAAPVTPPVAAPITPPVSAPVTPPVATPVTAAPVTPPVAAPVTPPVATPVTPPVATPVTPPVAAPATPPLAAPVTPPVTPPVAPAPVAVPPPTTSPTTAVPTATAVPIKAGPPPITSPATTRPTKAIPPPTTSPTTAAPIKAGPPPITNPVTARPTKAIPPPITSPTTAAPAPVTPVAAPVTPPVAAPVTPPITPPVAPAPVAAPVTPPAAAPGDSEGAVSVVYIENIENAQFFFGGSTLIDGTSQMSPGKSVAKGKGMSPGRRWSRSLDSMYYRL